MRAQLLQDGLQYRQADEGVSGSLFRYKSVLYLLYILHDFSMDRADVSGVLVEFLTWPIIRYKREVLFGWVDLLVSFGGIASLFLGFSLLSGVEIIYYFTLRACCMVYKNRVSINRSQ